MSAFFDYPWVLSAFAVFIPMLLFDFFSGIKKPRRKLPRSLRGKMLGSAVFFRIFIACVIIALVGPRWGTGESAGEYRRLLDAVIAIDVSRSMEIRDEAPLAGIPSHNGTVSRLERGLAIAENALAAAPGGRFAAALGKGRGFLALPLTWDNETILNFLESLDSSSLSGRGTSLESLVDAAASAFQNTFPSRRLILLVSDGEALSGSLRAALDRCIRDDIMVSALALGSSEGRPVPGQEELTSRRDSRAMRMAAERTGGLYLDGSRQDAPAVLADHLRSLAAETGTRGFRREKKQRWYFFIIAGIIAWAASRVILLKIPNAFLITAGCLFLASCSPGKLLIMEANFKNSRGRYNDALVAYLKALEYEDAAPYAEYGLGSVYYSLDESKAALERFAESQTILDNLSPAEHRELRYRNSYNSGVVLFGEGDFSAAAAAFKEALRLEPDRFEAKRNLELSLLSAAGAAWGREKAGEGAPHRQDGESRAALFEYLKQKELQQWKSREWGLGDNEPGPDY